MDSAVPKESTEFKEGGVGHYVLVWLTLLGFTALTYGLSKVELGAWSLPVALLIAAAKTGLVMIFFMHFLHEFGMSRMSMALALLFLASLAILAVADAATRFPPALVREHGARQPLHIQRLNIRG